MDLATQTITQLPTLTELEALKAQYMAQGFSLFDDLALVIKEMGTFINAPGVYYWQLCEGKIEAIYTEHNGPWLPFKKENDGFSMTRCVGVYLGNNRTTQVCYLHMTDNPNFDTSKDIYVPGQWEQRVLARLAAAKAQVAQRETNADMLARSILANKLLIGQKV